MSKNIWLGKEVYEESKMLRERMAILVLDMLDLRHMQGHVVVWRELK